MADLRCPMCGTEGVEEHRESCIHPDTGKLVDFVVVRCEAHGGAFIVYDHSIRDYEPAEGGA